MNNILIEHGVLKKGDKVRVLRNDNPDKSLWKTLYHGVVMEVATKGWVKVWDPKVTDANSGLFGESEQWVASNSKMTRVIKD